MCETRKDNIPKFSSSKTKCLLRTKIEKTLITTNFRPFLLNLNSESLLSYWQKCVDFLGSECTSRNRAREESTVIGRD